MHQNPSETCQICAEKLEGCHNSIKLWFEIISDNFKDCHVAIGFRGEADQEAALQNHLTHAPWPQSKHNRMENGKPCSWAIDVFQLSAEGIAVFNPNYFQSIWNLINRIQSEASDQEMYWGGLFTNLKDMDHFELLKVEVVQSVQILSQDSC
jgi:hypothetical protein